MIQFPSFTVEEIPLGPTSLKAKNIHCFIPSLSDDRKFFVVEFVPWSVDAFSESMTGLKEEVCKQIAMLWSFLVKEEDINLTVDAKRVKDRLSLDWEEV